MPNSYFQFKQFRVNQEKSAMKVCTDSCILGAYASYPNPHRILDIGAGTGLLSLMLAQKYSSEIDAIEINENSFYQAKENFLCSPWNNRLNIIHSPIQEYQKSTSFKYDLIVCNPPFFNNHLKSPIVDRNLALHNDSLSYYELGEVVSRLLTEGGLFYNLLPEYESGVFNKTLEPLCIFPIKRLMIYNAKGKRIFRIITTYSILNKEIEEEEMAIKTVGGEYSQAFRELLRDYYLHL